jgi:CheY-like chemotaxis protein
VLRVLKEDPATRDIPVITLSASVGPADRRGASEAGSIAFIAKPLMPDRVVDIVRQVLLGTA